MTAKRSLPFALLFASIATAGCAVLAAQRAHVEERPTRLPALEPARRLEAGEGAQQISTVSWGIGAFNPSHGDRATLTYSLAHADPVTIRLYDPDGGLVRALLEASPREAGPHQELWDGRDEDGEIVPDEAYLATIETASGIIYDPTTFSGGVVGDLTDAQFDQETGTMVYRLPAASRVLIRLGLHNGPMLKTLVDWKPRVAGAITEYWDGYDEDHLISMRKQEDFTALITYATLPEATIITYGNNRETYRDYKLGRAHDRPQKPKRPRNPDPEGRLLGENLVPPAWAQAPRVLLIFPAYEGHEGSVPEVTQAIDVRIDVDPADRDHLLRDQFEVIFFVDNMFVAEAERGYLPFNWRWELNHLPAGEHVLTVNISSFKGQVGLASRKVRVVKPAP